VDDCLLGSPQYNQRVKRKTTRAVIFYFSGTGNTWLAASRIAQELKRHGVSSDLAALEETSGVPDISDYDMVGIGYPVYSFAIPGYVHRFLKKRLPAGEGRKAFVFSTMGGGTFGSEALASFLLRRRGYRVIAARPFIAPTNDMVLIGSQAPDSPLAKASIAGLLADVSSWVRQMLEGKAGISGDNPMMKLGAAALGFAFSKMISFHAFSMPFWFLKADERCTRCGLCERICPVGNIKGSLSNPRFGTRCIFCERCLNLCPHNAVHFLLSRRRPQYRAPGFTPPLLRAATR